MQSGTERATGEQYLDRLNQKVHCLSQARDPSQFHILHFGFTASQLKAPSKPSHKTQQHINVWIAVLHDHSNQIYTGSTQRAA
jgi:hypothetical protein